MKKKSLIIICFFIILGLFIIPNSTYAGEKKSVKIDGITYEVEDDTATLVDVSYDEYVAAKNSNSLDIYDTAWPGDGTCYVVTDIAENAITTDKFKEIRIWGVERIEKNAVTSHSKYVWIDKNVKYIDKDAFSSYKADIHIDLENPKYFIGRIYFI